MGFVVIAEPDEVNAARIKTILDSLDKDFSYALVGSAEAAIQLVEQNTTDVFIADMQMPVIKGTELFSMIEMMSPETIRIVLFRRHRPGRSPGAGCRTGAGAGDGVQHDGAGVSGAPQDVADAGKQQ